MSNEIYPSMIDAIKVQFIKPIFDEDFPEIGMTAWLTGIDYDAKDDDYTLYFDFTDFEGMNDKYFRETYHPNIRTQAFKEKPLYTAIEAGYYTQKYNVCFSVERTANNKTMGKAASFMWAIREYLRVVEHKPAVHQ